MGRVALMSSRAVSWVLGSVGGIVLALCVPETLFPGVRVVVMGATLVSVGLLGEWAHAAGARRSRATSRAPRDRRPADGQVEVARLAGMLREPNPYDPRFGRFLGLSGEPGESLAPSAGGVGPGSSRTCPPLLGRVALVSLYLGFDGERWADDEIAASHAALWRAGLWVEREARRWGAPVNVEIAEAYFTADIDEGPPGENDVVFDHVGDEVVAFEEKEESKLFAAVNRAAVSSGFRDAVELFQTIEGRLAADAVVWLVLPFRAGVSRAFPADRAGALLPGVSLAVCYVREKPFPEPLKGPAVTDPVSVVHEMLHLFGATDKYGYQLRAYGDRTVSGREVMRLDETRLGRLQVDPLTALEVGWTDRLSPKKPTTAVSPGGSRRSSVSQGDEEREG